MRGLMRRARASSTSVKNGNGHSATRRTVIVAGVANIVVGLAKLGAGILSGSSAMLAEPAHSAADTLHQVFLLASLRQAERPADDDHQFGHGQERYFWALLAAFGIFIAGAGFSIFEGLLSLTRSHSESPLAAYVTLGVAFVAEGTSFVRAFWQVRREAGGHSEEVLGHMKSSPDITVKVALFEDSAAVVGLILAALGVGLGQLTGSSVWDGAASIAIGVLLVVVAIKLGMDSKALLIGRAAGSEVQQLIREEIESRPGVDALLELRTMHMGPDNLLVAARVALHDELRAVGHFTRDGMGSLAPAAANIFSHAMKLAGPDDRFVSINNDTIYSIAQVDVSGGPVRLRVPDTARRYYVLQFVDAWTNNFAYVGRRATGTEAGTFLLVPSGWQGDPPAGAQVIEFPTTVGTIVGRWACDGPADLGAVQALQNGLSLEPHGSPAPLSGIPAPAAVPAGLAFFEQMRTWMQAFPPSAPDQAYQKRFAPLGLLDQATPYDDCPPDRARALAAGADAARQQMETTL